MNESPDSGLGKTFEHIDEDLAVKIIESEVEGGMKIDSLPVGKTLVVKTMNTTYHIEKRLDGFYISGNPRFCPEPTPVRINGSTWGGSLLKTGFIGRGMHMEFALLNKSGESHATSPIESVEILGEEREISPEDQG
jgi:hypothetical protein